MHDFVDECLFGDFKTENWKRTFSFFIVLSLKKLSDMYGEEAFKLKQCQNWFAKCITVDEDIESSLELFFDQFNSMC